MSISMRGVGRVGRIVWIVAVAGHLTAAAAAAQDLSATESAGVLFDEAKIGRALERADFPIVRHLTMMAQQSAAEKPRRPEALMPLYASLVVVQGLDIHSTRRGLASGRRELNPVVEPLVRNSAAHIAAKAAATSAVILASEKLWRGRKRKTAIVLTVTTNAALAAVVAHNYRAAR